MAGKKWAGKPSLIEQSHNAWQARLRAKKRGDTKEVSRLTEFIDWCNQEIRKGKK